MINLRSPKGATPLDEDTLAGLIPDHISKQKELDEWEAQNIQEAVYWVYYKRKTKDVLTLKFLTDLHKRMFSKTWNWAGTWRKVGTNIGVDTAQILQELMYLLEETKYQLDNQIYSLEEVALRLHHKLVWIHPFPNGNGRHARLMADLLLKDNGLSPFNWGRNSDLVEDSQHRDNYIAALKAADNHDYSKLIKFLKQ